MVARKEDAELDQEVELPGFLGGLLLVWRRLLTRLLFWVGRLIFREQRRRDADAEMPWQERRWVAPVALVALAVGVIGGVALASPGPRLLAIAAGLASVAWAFLRLLLMRLVPPRPSRDPRALAGAWAVGLIVYAIALTPELRLAAWVLSGAITFFALQRLGRSRRDALWLTGIPWGTQAGVVVLSWLALNAYVALVAIRG